MIADNKEGVVCGATYEWISYLLFVTIAYIDWCDLVGHHT